MSAATLQVSRQASLNTLGTPNRARRVSGC